MEKLIQKHSNVTKKESCPLSIQGLKLSVGVCFVGLNQRDVRSSGFLEKYLQLRSTNVT